MGYWRPAVRARAPRPLKEKLYNMTMKPRLSIILTLIIVVAVAVFSIVALRVAQLYKSFSVIPGNQACECKNNFGDLAGERVTEKGYIRKERDDRDLGSEFMYVFYFDEPFIVWLNGSGSPQFAESIEVYKPQNETFLLDDYVGKHVEIAGELTWGYSESRAIEAQAIRVI